jgi:flagellar motor switch protein FliN/FliY
MAAAPGLAPHPFAEAIQKAVAEVFAQKFGSAWTVETSAPDTSTADAEKVSFGISVSGAFQGSAAIGLARSDVALLAQNFSDAATEASNEQEKAVQALLQEISQAAAAFLEAQFGSLTLQVNAINVPPWQGTAMVLRVADSEPRSVTLYLLISDELIKAMGSDVQSMPSASVADVKGIVSEANLDLLMGVDLALTLRFGTRTLTLREILDLSSGSVVELDRQVQEPADLLLGDKLIARGEVVIVDGNYGLRITELPEQGQQVAKNFNS